MQYAARSVFAERLKLLRQDKNIGQIQLAKDLDVGKSVISLWERGECEPTLSKLVAIANYFGVTIDLQREPAALPFLFDGPKT